MSIERVIKKYPNRRLYDMEESRYITLTDIRKLVLERIDFVIMDKRDQTDITRDVLLQVIAEQERKAGEPAMSRYFLTEVIRSHRTIGSYLEQSLRRFCGAVETSA